MRGGFYSLIEDILKEIEDKGGEINKKPVNKIITKNNEVKGIEVDNKFIGCANVISTISPIALNEIIDIPIGTRIKYQGTACALFAPPYLQCVL